MTKRSFLTLVATMALLAAILLASWGTVQPRAQTVVTGSAAVVTRDTTFNIPGPTTTDSGKWQAHYSDAVRIYRVYCSTDGLGTVSVNFEIRPESLPNNTGTTVLAAPLTCTGSGTATGGILNDLIPAGNLTSGYLVTPIITGTSGTPGMLRASMITQ